MTIAQATNPIIQTVFIVIIVIIELGYFFTSGIFGPRSGR
jgi:hypothetical protein